VSALIVVTYVAEVLGVVGIVAASVWWFVLVTRD
jgi:hypothetical protein